jgi:hypothetical protein
MDQPLLTNSKKKDEVLIEIDDKLENHYLKMTLNTYQRKIIPIMVLFTIYTVIFSGIFIVMIITYKK